MIVEHNQSTYYKSPYPTTNTGDYDNAWKFNGKELDAATGMYYYGARYYDPRISIFISVDPLAERYRNVGGYVYVANNPTMFIDPDGRKIRVYYNQRKNAEGKIIADYWDFNGTNESSAPDNQFVRDFLEAYNYNIKNGGGDNLKRAAFANELFELFESIAMGGSSFHNLYGRNIIKWDPLGGLMVSNGDILSAATILEHEFDHGVSMTYDTKGHLKRRDTKLKDYTNAEELRVISGSETKTARANGEISANKSQSRFSHGGNTRVPTESPTSTKVRNTKERTKSSSNKIIKGLYNYGK